MKTITLNQQEESALIALLDAGVKHIGWQAVDAAAIFKQKIENAKPPTRKKPNKVVKLKDAVPSNR